MNLLSLSNTTKYNKNDKYIKIIINTTECVELSILHSDTLLQLELNLTDITKYKIY